MALIDWIIIAVFLSALVTIGYAFSRRNKNIEDYFVAGRSMPGWLVAIAATGTSISAGTFVGSPELGFNTNITWKNWTLGAYFQFVTGNKVLTSNSYVDDGYSLTSNTSNAALNYWKQPGDTGVTPKPVAQNPGVYHAGYSTRFLQDGSYLRIKDVTLSYDVPSKFTDAIKIKGARIYVSALNPYTFHTVTSLDPEAGPLGNIEVGVHTAVKSLIGGVEISF